MLKLHYRSLGRGPAIVILHGLFGMSDNWLGIGQDLASRGFSVLLPDLRNHGLSPHTESHRYTEMADDLLHLLDEVGLNQVDLVGHSMGGKVAMVLALLNPERVRSLTVVDMAPVDYRSEAGTFHRDLIDQLKAIDPASFTERGALRQALAARIDDDQLVMLLAKNMHRDHNKAGFRYKFNLPVLERYLQHLYLGLDELSLYAPSLVPTLFLAAEQSDYILPEYEKTCRFFFPELQVVRVADAGHWLQADQPEVFLQLLEQFVTSRQRS